jgi:hypothetical protein
VPYVADFPELVTVGAREGSDGARGCTDGMELLTDGSRECIDGEKLLTDGARECTDGVKLLTDGARGCTDGAELLTDGARGLSAVFLVSSSGFLRGREGWICGWTDGDGGGS